LKLIYIQKVRFCINLELEWVNDFNN